MSVKRSAARETKRAVALPRTVDDAVRSPGQPLDAAARAGLEHRLGHDFARVRLHVGAQAAASASAVGAAAFALGDDIVFGEGNYAPGTTAGRRLIAHELAHVAQQRGASVTETPAIAPSDGAAEREADAAARAVSQCGDAAIRNSRLGTRAIQRQPAGPSGPITARAILPFEPRRQIQIDSILDQELADLVSGFDPNASELLRTLRGQRATITASTDDLVEAEFNQRELTLPGLGTFREVKLSLTRSAAGSLTFEVSGVTGEPPARAPIFSRAGLTASRSDAGYVLSSGSATSPVREIGVRPRSQGVDLRVFTERFANQVPTWARRLLPGHVDVLSLTELPPAEAGNEAVQRAAREATGRAAAARGAQAPRQQVEVGAGLTSFSDPRFLLRTSWQYTFQPLPPAGSLLGIPLQVAIQYVPGSNVLGRISGGASTSLSALRIPVNLRVTAGVAGGATLAGGPGRPGTPIGGITLGGGIGIDLARWCVQLDYDHVINLVNQSDFPGASSVVLSGGIGF